MQKTNAMRLLTQAKIPFSTSEYEFDESDFNGMHAALQTGIPPEQVFKTLVACNEKGAHFVFCIPVCCELDLKKAAKAAGAKKIELIHVKELLPLTGYVRGGCSPIGMKKDFPAFLEETAALYPEIAISAGVRGCQLLLSPDALAAYRSMTYADLTE